MEPIVFLKGLIIGFAMAVPGGPVGMVLCIPLTMTLKFAVENNKGTEWIAGLLGSEKPIKGIPLML